MTATLIDEPALPDVRPVAGAVVDGADALRNATAGLRAAAHDAGRTWSGIDAVLRSPGATDALPRAMDAPVATADGLASAGAAVAAALETFADQVTTVRRRRRALLADIEELRARVSASGGNDTVPVEHRADNDELHGRARRLRSRWAQAQDDLNGVFRARSGSGGLFLPGLGGGTAPPLVMVDLAGVARGFDDALRLPLLRQLAARGPEALGRWAAEHPHEAARLLDHPPAARTVAAWWDGLGTDERTALVTGFSAVVGNLEGVRYADRARANRHTLEVELPRARARYAALSADIARSRPLSVAERAEYTLLAERVGALAALDRTLRASTAAAPRTVVALTLGSPPLAAVAVGDLDTASRITVAVPGMGNTVAGDIEAWTAGAGNLREAQRSAADRLGVDRDVATVAWIGYDTPDMPPSVEVLGSRKAAAGAVRLRSFLEGASGTRGWPAGAHLAVVAHSYGTTTATLAVAQTPVADLTLLASAGIDPSVPDARAVEVPRGHVWASQADRDFVANVGRGSVELPLPTAGDASAPDRVTVADLASTHRLDPRAPGWRARTFSSDDEVIEGRSFRGSDGHAATPAAEAALRGEPGKDVGYLDRGTSSLRNTAYTSLGFTPGGRKIP